jgi:TfoX/Sxy family transcriptional regulator of competence genes
VNGTLRRRTGMAAKAASRQRPRFLPAPEKLKQAFGRLVEGLPGVEPRKMFGYPCAFVNGQMFVGIFQDRLMLRLADDDRAKFLKLRGAKLFEPMPGRVMKEYVEVPAALLSAEAELKKWLKRGLAYAQSLPPKTKKPQRP